MFQLTKSLGVPVKMIPIVFHIICINHANAGLTEIGECVLS